MKGRVICLLCNLLMVANAVSNNSAKLCIFVHGLGMDWENHEEGIHNAETEKYQLIGEDIHFWENYKGVTVEAYWEGLPKKMQDRGICDSNYTYLTKFDTVGSSMEDFKVHEARFCELVNSPQGTLVFAHSLGNYIAGDFKCIGKVEKFISIASPWEMNNYIIRDLLCFASPFNPVGWVAHFIDKCFDFKLFNQGICEDSFEFLFNEDERKRVKDKMGKELNANNSIFFCAKNEEWIDPADSCMNPPVEGAKKLKVTGAHSTILKRKKLANEIVKFLSESESSLGQDLEMQSNIEYDL